MTDRDLDLDQAFRTIVRAAVSDAPSSQDVITDTVVARRQRRWVAAAAALVLVAAGVAATALAVRDRPAVTTPGTTSVATTDGAPTSSSSTSTSTTTTASPSTLPLERSTVSADVAGPLGHVVLHSAGVGAGQNDLGLESECSYCMTPWAPLVTADGTLVIADTVNHRWVIVRDNATDVAPFPTGGEIDGQPRLGPDGLVYAPMAVFDATKGASSYVVFAYQVEDMSAATATFPIHGGAYSFVYFVGNDLMESSSQRPITSVAAPRSLSRRFTEIATIVSS